MSRRIINVEKTSSDAKVTFDNGYVVRAVDIADVSHNGDIITIFFRNAGPFVLDFNDPSLNKQGQSTPDDLITFWRENNFFFNLKPLVPDNQQVDTFANLPAASTATDQIWFVRQQTGVWILGTRRQSGFYVSDGATWTHTNDPLQYLIDDQFVLKDDIDNTKQVDFQLSGITTGTKRTLTPQDKSYTIADQQDIDDHIAETTDAHDASAISYDNTGSGLSAIEVQAAIDEVLGEIIFRESFVSADQTIVSGGSVTVAHGLPSRPSLIIPELVCIAADVGYQIGDIIQVKYLDSTTFFFASDKGITIVSDATNIFVRYADDTDVFVAHDNVGTLGEVVTLANANWELRLTAYA